MLTNFIRKIIYFEYWPWQIFYIPLYPYLVYLIIKHKTAFAFSAINSGISADSGLFTANKYDILKKVPIGYKPNECLITIADSEEQVIEKVKENGLEFPLICKPIFGERGDDVEKLESPLSLRKYYQELQESFVVQEFIDLKEEFGIVFFKHPDTHEVEITSIVQKELLSVVGDGNRKVSDLLKESSRGHLYLSKIIKKYPELADKIIEKDQLQIVEPIGNHCRGTKFIDRNDLLDSTVVLKKVKEVVLPLDNIHFGRLDLKVESEAKLLQEEGKITVFEINGVHAEPSHIYDSKTSIIKAYRDLYAQWDKIFVYGKICANKGVPCLKLRKFVSLVFQRP